MAGSHFSFLGDSIRALPVVLNRIWGAQRLDLRSLTVQREPESAAAREIEAALWRDRRDVRLRCVELNEGVERLEAELSAAVAV
jgi:hypothetical protein